MRFAADGEFLASVSDGEFALPWQVGHEMTEAEIAAEVDRVCGPWVKP